MRAGLEEARLGRGGVVVVEGAAGLERLADLTRPPVPERDDLAALLSVAGVSLLPSGWGVS